MNKRTSRRLIVLLFIGALLLLSCHIHPHHFSSCGEVDHCPLCQILHSGFTFGPSLKLVLLLILMGLITFLPPAALKLFSPTGCDNRAPPFHLFSDHFSQA